MLSKFLRASWKCSYNLLSIKRVPQKIICIRYGDLVPASQYDIPFPRKFQLGVLVREYWETIPLLVTTAFAIFVVVFAVIWATQNKVDAVFSTHSRRSISRTMNLRSPTVHKLLIINQRYEPWPEMQDILDKMTTAEKRALMRAQTCSLQQQGH